jgi:hypothetical protein
MFKFVLLKPSLLQLIVMMKSTIIHFKLSFSHTQFRLATLNINKEHKTVESSKLYYLIN